MNRYVLKFCKHGNMRFISHLDIARLFKRAIRKGGIKIAFSNGFNPHELINIVQPLSLGYESNAELVEIETYLPYDSADLMERLNLSMPEGIRFTACREIPRSSKNLSYYTQYALYEAILPSYSKDCNPLNLDAFTSQEQVVILKRDKKTKKLVEKDVKNMIFEMSFDSDNPMVIIMNLRCASNETLNPGKLLEGLFKYCESDIKIEDVRITRKLLLSGDCADNFIDAFDTETVGNPALA